MNQNVQNSIIAITYKNIYYKFRPHVTSLARFFQLVDAHHHFREYFSRVRNGSLSSTREKS